MTESKRFEDFETGETYHSSGRTLTESDIRQFIGATGSTDPIHVDHEYAKEHPLVEGVVAQGTLLLGVTDGFLVEMVANDAALAMNHGHDEVRYLKPVYPGDTLEAVGEIVGTELQSEEWGVVTVELEVTNQNDERVLVDIHRLLVATGKNTVQ